MNVKSQAVSADALVAVALFIMVIIFFFAFSGSSATERRVGDLKLESSKLVSSLSATRNNSGSLLIGSRVNSPWLDHLSTLNYSALKDTVGIEADFCFHFEDEDGNVINVTGNKTGLGSHHVSVGGVACG